jgi:ketosteroid isomerase-like protein
MSTKSNVKLIQEAYAAFGRKDIPALLNALADDVEWVVPGPAEIPTAGTYRGRDHVARFFSKLDESATFTAFEPRKFVAQDDTVIALGYSAGTAKATGRRLETEWAMVFTLRDGKIARYQIYSDTANAAAAYAGTRAAGA